MDETHPGGGHADRAQDPESAAAGGWRGLTPDAFEAACLALPGATLSIQWGGAHVFKVGGKIFAIVGLGGGEGPRFSFKASDMAFELLIEHGLARPAPYLQRAKWVQLVRAEALSDHEITAYLAQAHALIAARLTRAVRREIGLGQDEVTVRFSRPRPRPG